MLKRTFFFSPTRLSAFSVLWYPGDCEKHLPLYKGHHRTPPLFVALDSIERHSEQLGHLLLCLVQFLAEVDELFAVH